MNYVLLIFRLDSWNTLIQRPSISKGKERVRLSVQARLVQVISLSYWGAAQFPTFFLSVISVPVSHIGRQLDRIKKVSDSVTIQRSGCARGRAPTQPKIAQLLTQNPTGAGAWWVNHSTSEWNQFLSGIGKGKLISSRKSGMHIRSKYVQWPSAVFANLASRILALSSHFRCMHVTPVTWAFMPIYSDLVIYRLRSFWRQSGMDRPTEFSNQTGWTSIKFQHHWVKASWGKPWSLCRSWVKKFDSWLISAPSYGNMAGTFEYVFCENLKIAAGMRRGLDAVRLA